MRGPGSESSRAHSPIHSMTTNSARGSCSLSINKPEPTGTQQCVSGGGQARKGRRDTTERDDLHRHFANASPNSRYRVRGGR